MHYSGNTHIAYAKLSATPTETAWSQVYNAGNLFACISLTRTAAGETEKTLQALGKDILNHFESEFFTLEEKNLTTIKEALIKSTKTLPEEVAITFCLAYFNEATLSLFLLGNGKILLKRGEQLGVLLQQETENRALHTASGYVRHGDIVLLATHNFTKHLSSKHINEALELSLPNDIAEELSVPMHAKADGAQAAIVISYQGAGQQGEQHKIQKDNQLINDEQKEEPTRQMDMNEKEPQKKNHISLPKLSLPHLPFSFPLLLKKIHLSHSKKLFLSIIILLIILLTVSITFTKRQQQKKQIQEQFDAIYTPASKLYDEGKALADLNKAVRDEDFQKAETLLREGQQKFPADSEEAQKIAALLAQIQNEGETIVKDTVKPKKVSVEKTSLLAVEQNTKNGLAFTQDEKHVYVVTDKKIIQVSKKDGEKKTLMTNDNSWKKTVGISVYNGNLYLLDQGDNILKYVVGSDGFGKGTYFSNPPDLTKAVSMSIDSAVYLLFSDGTVNKYLRGEKESFSLKGLNTSLSHPTKIVTNADLDSIYILDPQNSRIVTLNKQGAFQNEYVAGVLKQAEDFEVTDAGKTILVLSNNKIWEITVDK